MLKENKDKFDLSIPPVKFGENDTVTSDAVTTTLRRAVRFVSAMQTSDGHWAAEIGGPLFFMPPLVIKSMIYNTIINQLSSRLINQQVLQTERYSHCT